MLRYGAFLILPLMFGGCASYMASQQPAQKNLAVLTPKTDRDLVIAELGAPVISEMTNEGKKEIYTFVQGYHKASKLGRSLWHGAADVMTIGLWEVVGTPLEGAFNGQKMSVSVTFDAENKVKDSKVLSVSQPDKK